MSCSLTNLVDNLSEGLHNDKCTDSISYLYYMSIKDDQLIFTCFDCGFANIYEFCDGDIKIFILLLIKGVYSYEYMDSWKRYDET